MNTQFITKTVQPAKAVGSFEQWLYNLLNAGWTGGWTAVSAWASLALAHGAGLDVPTLNIKAAATVFGVNAFIKVALFAKDGLPQIFNQGPPGDTPPQTDNSNPVTPVNPVEK